MLLKNASKGSKQFSTNHMPKNATTPAVSFVQIPAGATVEVDDVLWGRILKAKTKVQVYESTQVEIGVKGLGQAKMGDEVLTKTVKISTGRFKEVSLVAEMIKDKQLIVMESPKLQLPTAKLVKQLNLLKGVFVDEEGFSREELEELYYENLHKIEAALAPLKTKA